MRSDLSHYVSDRIATDGERLRRCARVLRRQAPNGWCALS
jgi:hypothetical protein